MAAGGLPSQRRRGGSIRACWQSPSAPRRPPMLILAQSLPPRPAMCLALPIVGDQRRGDADHNVLSGVDVHARARIHGLRYHITKVYQ